MARDLKLTLDIATKAAVDSLKKASKATKDLSTDIDDTRTAGKKMADAMGVAAKAIEADFAAADSAAAKLADALGPELVAAANSAGRGVDDMVSSLKRAGLSYEEIEADVDSLAASIRQLDSAGSSVGGLSRGSPV